MSKSEKKENKNIKIAKEIESLKLGETISPTKLALNSQIHPNTLRDLLDLHSSLQELGFEILRDSERKIKAILKTDDSLDLKRELNQIKNEINNISTSLEEIKSILKKR
jgi:hypothetical protein